MRPGRARDRDAAAEVHKQKQRKGAEGRNVASAGLPISLVPIANIAGITIAARAAPEAPPDPCRGGEATPRTPSTPPPKPPRISCVRPGRDRTEDCDHSASIAPLAAAGISSGLERVDAVICGTCAVEHPPGATRCAICSDERQWVPAAGQAWCTLRELRAAGTTVEITELEPGLHGLSTSPAVGIGKQAKLLVTAAGNLLWDPLGYLEDAAIEQVRALGPVAAIAASHPHMFGVQLEWSRHLRDPPVYVNEANLAWVARPGAAIRAWRGSLEVLPGVTLLEVGGHFPGSAVVHFTATDGRGVLLSSDTVFVNPDRASVAFMRSFPNHIPLSPAVVARILATLEPFEYDRLYGNFKNTIPGEARGIVRRSAERHAAWLRGEHDDET